MNVARALLFVPGDRPERIATALASEADAVAVDFEDAVADAAKDRARNRTADALAGTADRDGPAVYVRINALNIVWARADMAAVAAMAATARLAGVIVPKVESAAQLHRLDGELATAERAAGLETGRLSVVPVVETARAVVESAAIAAAGPRVRTLLFGTLDLAGDLGVWPSAEGRELLHARSQVVVAARAAGLPGPLDGPHPDLEDEDGLVRSSLAARELGFTGRAVLHPRQVAPVRRAFAPTAAELDRARAVLEAYRRARDAGAGALRLPDGTFVDRPVAVRAAAVLRDAGAETGAGAAVPR